MTETKRSRWGSFLCWLAGHHVGNVQWGEDGPDGRMVHKCSCCWRTSGDDDDVAETPSDPPPKGAPREAPALETVQK